MKCTILLQDIGQKLDNCIFRYKGHPYLVEHMGNKKLNLHRLSGGVEHTILFNDPDLDISSVPLGYVNWKHPAYNNKNTVLYFSRYPVRKVKQGVCSENVFMNSLGGDKGGGNKNTILFSKAMEDTIMNVFPKLEDALKKLRADFKNIPDVGQNNLRPEVAVSRSIAMYIDPMGIIKVYHKNVYVGWIAPDDYTVHVKSNDLGWVVSKYLHHILGWKVD